jgi:hypothetical protein
MRMEIFLTTANMVLFVDVYPRAGQRFSRRRNAEAQSDSIVTTKTNPRICHLRGGSIFSRASANADCAVACPLVAI